MEQQHQYLSETQNIDISSLQLMPLHMNNAIPTQVRRASGPNLKKKNKTIERTTLKQLNHSHMNLEQQPMLSMKNSQQINIPLVNPKNFKSTSGLDQQARLDELISHVKAAAAVVAGYHTSTATAALIVSTCSEPNLYRVAPPPQPVGHPPRSSLPPPRP